MKNKNIVEKIKKIIENEKKIKIENKEIDKIFDKYIAKYNETFNENWGEHWYLTEEKLTSYDFLLAIYFIGEWSFKYQGEVYGMYTEGKNDNKVYSTGNKLNIEEKDYFEFLDKLYIGDKNIIDIIDDVCVYKYA